MCQFLVPILQTTRTQIMSKGLHNKCTPFFAFPLSVQPFLLPTATTPPFTKYNTEIPMHNKWMQTWAEGAYYNLAPQLGNLQIPFTVDVL